MGNSTFDLEVTPPASTYVANSTSVLPSTSRSMRNSTTDLEVTLAASTHVAESTSVLTITDVTTILSGTTIPTSVGDIPYNLTIPAATLSVSLSTAIVVTASTSVPPTPTIVTVTHSMTSSTATLTIPATSGPFLITIGGPLQPWATTLFIPTTAAIVSVSAHGTNTTLSVPGPDSTSRLKVSIPFPSSDSKGSLVGVGLGVGFVAIILVLVLLWREFKWRKTLKRRLLARQRTSSWERQPGEGMALVTHKLKPVPASPFNDAVGLARQYTDNEILFEVNQLHDDVTGWVQQLSLPSASLQVEHLQEIDDILRILFILPQLRKIQDLPGYLHDRKQVKSFLRGLLWCIIVDSIFRTPGQYHSNTTTPSPDKPSPMPTSTRSRGLRHRDITPCTARSTGQDHWLPPEINSSLGILQRAVHPHSDPSMLVLGSSSDGGAASGHGGPDVASFHQWRAATYALLGRAYGHSSKDWQAGAAQNYVQGRAEAIVRLLRPWMGNSGSTGQNQRSLAAVLLQALELSCLLRQQRAEWSLRFPGPRERPTSGPSGMAFDWKTMSKAHGAGGEDVPRSTKENGAPVRILITPALCKRGNMDGEKYDADEFVVQKAEVQC